MESQKGIEGHCTEKSFCSAVLRTFHWLLESSYLHPASQVSSTPEQPPLQHLWRPRSGFEPLSIRFRTAFDPICFETGPESDQKRLQIRSGSGPVRKGGCLKLDLDLAGPNISILEIVRGEVGGVQSTGASQTVRVEGTSPKVFPPQENCSKQGIWSSQVSMDLFQLICRLSTSPWPKNRVSREVLGTFSLLSVTN